MDALIERLKKHESLSLTVYPDRDKWAIGYGHQCSQDHPPITREKAEEYLREDVYKASDAYVKWKVKHGLKLTKTRDECLVELIVWHGFLGFLGFEKMIAALLRGDYEDASDEMRDSQSGRECFARMYELSTLMLEG